MNDSTCADRRLRVVVVDNDHDNADSMGMLAGMWGHEVRVVYGGIEALAIDPDFLPDVMLLDIGMPQMDGHELARRMRRLAGRDDVFLIAVTGYGYEKEFHLAYAAGFDRVLLKPVDPMVIKVLLAKAGASLDLAVAGAETSRRPSRKDVLQGAEPKHCPRGEIVA
jgi:two-component system, chemotaxis family, CheB/CheR fusion protein